MTASEDDVAGGYGIALLERSLLRDLRTLWEGPLDPSYLHGIEITLRAFMTAQVLTVSRVDLPWDVRPDLWMDDVRDWQAPFNDHLLDYEFTHPGKKHPIAGLEASERTFLEDLVTQQVQDRARQAIPKWVKKLGQVSAFLDAWYAGFPKDECAQFTRDMTGYEDDDDAHQPWRPDDPEALHLVFHKVPSEHARYLVGAHRAGLTVYGSSPVYDACADHIFSQWPRRIFEGFENAYQETVRMIRGPGVGVDLPPLTAVLLSRAKDRQEIPSALRELREEYQEPRRALWQALEQMWQAPTLEKQVSRLRELDGAASAVFHAAFPQKFDVLELGLGIAQLTPGGIAQAFRSARERDRPNARVSAFAFTKRLSTDLRTIENARKALKRHLTAAELLQFGI